MLSRVARTLLASPGIERVVVLSQSPEALVDRPETKWLAAEPRVRFRVSAGSISRSVADVAGSADAPWPVLVTTADHPLLTPDMVAAFVAGAGGADVAVALVERRTLLARYPGNRRTWLRVSGRGLQRRQPVRADRCACACRARSVGRRRAGSQEGLEARRGVRTVAAASRSDAQHHAPCWPRGGRAAPRPCRGAGGARPGGSGD
jgi:hypothetical protein